MSSSVFLENDHMHARFGVAFTIFFPVSFLTTIGCYLGLFIDKK